jgi:predicted nucleic acid-binding protein
LTLWATKVPLCQRSGDWRLQLTVYDAAYLELAQRRNLPLPTLDGELRAAAKSLGLGLMGME